MQVSCDAPAPYEAPNFKIGQQIESLVRQVLVNFLSQIIDKLSTISCRSQFLLVD